jgi:hypothetical protein
MPRLRSKARTRRASEEIIGVEAMSVQVGTGVVVGLAAVTFRCGSECRQ